ncbi:MAG: histidine phosphatase family protein [Chloroflexi bacterium]|nr:histidine phosphatase family protein [Chloroflexota bacterium]
MRTLLVMRHAKSVWSKGDEPALPDRLRPLTAKGKRDAERQGETLKAQQLIPDIIVSSPAKRARSTAKRTAHGCGYTGELQVDERLYMQGSERCLLLAAEWEDDIHCGMLIGHNPDISELVQMLTCKLVVLDTAGLARLEVPIASWQELTLRPSSRLAAVY